MNQLIAIVPYWLKGTWVFDDESAGLVQEPFVCGVPEMIDLLTKEIPNAKKGFRLIFSASPFPDFQIKLDWIEEEYNGNWYFSEKFDKKGWLCPALFAYFSDAPKQIYVKAESIHCPNNH
jgi:hypothetical protein